MKTPSAWTLLAVSTGLAACAGSGRSVTGDGVVAVEAPAVSVPMDVRGSYDSAWDYLAMRYDADADGTITPAEYDREGGRFERLDRDGDGVLTPADFADGEEMDRRITSMEARRMVAEYLQDDEDPTELAVWEMFAAAEAYDADRDERLEEHEFRALAAERRQATPDEGMRRFTADLDPWEGLVRGIDFDADGALAFAELERFFEGLDDGDDVWSLAEPEVEEAASPGGTPSSGPTVGTLAPDFTLGPPDGGAAVTLSAFRGERPVALIFGSYT